MDRESENEGRKEGGGEERRKEGGDSVVGSERDVGEEGKEGRRRGRE